MINKDQWSNLVDAVTGKGSRKVVFGFVVFWIASAFLADGKISSQQWLYCVLGAGLLIGFGTILDNIVERMGEKAVDILSTIVSARFPAPAAKPEAAQ